MYDPTTYLFRKGRPFGERRPFGPKVSSGMISHHLLASRQQVKYPTVSFSIFFFLSAFSFRQNGGQ